MRPGRALLAAALLPALAVAPLTASRLLGGSRGSPLVQLASFAPWGLAGWALSAVVLLLGRRWRLALVPLLLAAMQLWWLVPPEAARDVPAVGGGLPLRVMTLNAEYGRADPAVIARTVAERRVDVLVVVELTRPMDSTLEAALGGRLPYQEVHSSEPGNAVGSGVWSRYPLRLIEMPPAQWYTMRMTVRQPGADPATLSVVHTTSPLPQQLDGWRHDLQKIAATVRAVPGPELVVGDFNAGRDHHPFRDILDAGVVDAADALPGRPRAGFTWPANAAPVPPAVRIDHVLVTPGDFAARSVGTVRIPGTDHLAVVAELAVRPSQAPPGATA